MSLIKKPYKKWSSAWLLSYFSWKVFRANIETKIKSKHIYCSVYISIYVYFGVTNLRWDPLSVRGPIVWHRSFFLRIIYSSFFYIFIFFFISSPLVSHRPHNRYISKAESISSYLYIYTDLYIYTHMIVPNLNYLI